VVIYIVTLIVVWLISAAVAAGVAPRERRPEFFLLTLFFLGPLGVGFAAVAVPREPAPPGRWRIVCPRCVAPQYARMGAHEFDCWRCNQRLRIDEWGRLLGPSDGTASKTAVQAASKPNIAATSTPTGKTTKVRCTKCQHTQQVPVSTTNFQCEECNAKLTRKKIS
jgi:ribosomal protein S27E